MRSDYVSGILSLAAASLLAASAQAIEMPWHIGSAKGEKQAPAAINTAEIKSGPHVIVVAVIDSGILPSHPSLEGQLLNGYDMLSPPNNLRGSRSDNFNPDQRDASCGTRLVSEQFRTHGTEIASLIAGNGKNDVWGVNPKAKVLPIRAFGACGTSRTDLLDAIAWAAGFHVDGVPDNTTPARVINMSFAGGGAACGDDMQKLINLIVERKIFVVAAAGNNFRKPLTEPANCKGVISVGALDAENRIEVYSALDSRTSVYAPGGGKKLSAEGAWSVNKLKVATFDLDVLGKERAASGFRGIGTSYAAPVVSGFIALWLSYYPEKGVPDFFRELDDFTRQVEPIIECKTCQPKGLGVNSGKLLQ